MFKDVDERHLSVSAIKTYLRCPKQFEFAYVENLKQPPDLKLALGKAVHTGIEVNFRHKFKKKRDLKVDTVMDATRDAFRTTVQSDDVKLTRVEFGQGTDEAVAMAKSYHISMAPRHQPLIEPESMFEIPVAGSKRMFKGFIDLLSRFFVPGNTLNEAVVDHKTTTRMYDQKQVDTDIQLTGYAYALRKLGYAVKDVVFDVIVRGKTPKVSAIRSDRSARDMNRFESTFQQVERGIKAGIFYPTDNHFNCGWCGYRERCWKSKRSWI